MSTSITFQVETDRILKILANEIYDSPLALLRENVQNAYDAVRMRYIPIGQPLTNGRIDIEVSEFTIAISDNGVGMTETALREHFWKAGSSGKRTTAAAKAGVVGTFGIGAMANFGVCSKLVVETRAVDGDDGVRSVAVREQLEIGKECITVEKIAKPDAGTTVTATMDTGHSITPNQAKDYLRPYVAFVPVAIYLNNELISQVSYRDELALKSRGFSPLQSQRVSDSTFSAQMDIEANPNGQVLVILSSIEIGGRSVEGDGAFLQGAGQMMGLRSHFGLAPVPVVGVFQFGGFINLPILQPTAGREALSRDSVEKVNQIVNLAERSSAEAIAQTAFADSNNAFLQWIRNHNRYDLAQGLRIRLLPDDQDVTLGSVQQKMGKRVAHYYTGTDPQILAMFANETSCLLQVAQGNPRKAVQMHYLEQILRIPQAPDAAQVTRIYSGAELTTAEVSVLLRFVAVIREDYLIPDCEARLADISHGVTVFPKTENSHLVVYLSRSSPLLPPLLEFAEKAWDVFGALMKDFVRVHVYKRIEKFVPSSTRSGVEALRKLLQQNRELYRYEEEEYGDFKTALGDYLAGSVSFEEVLTTSRTRAKVHTQSVSSDQVGVVERVVADVVSSLPIQTAPQAEGAEFIACPPIIRDEIESDFKILTTTEKYPQLNNFAMLLGLSDRLMRTEGDFFRWPHTTRIIWGGHRVVFIFTEGTGRISLYYDVELREALDASEAGGGLYPTTTLITKRRIFVPVPDQLISAFEITGGAREFYVRYDTITNDS